MKTINSSIPHLLKCVFPVVVIALFSQCNLKPYVSLTTDAVDTTAGNVACFKIETPAATYYLEKSGMGLSSIVDKDGNDWINFHKKPGTRAAGEYRGFPNAVHKQDGSFFHPKNEDTDISTARVEHSGRDRVTITGISGNHNWECRWDFYPEHCRLAVTKMSSGYKYWVLYEGTPGGHFDIDDWWMTSEKEKKIPMTIPHKGDIPAPEWIVFGDKDINRVLFLMHREDDEHPDNFYQMNKKMTVFGFGREGIEKFLDNVPQHFLIGFIESTDYNELSKTLKRSGEKNDLFPCKQTR